MAFLTCIIWYYIIHAIIFSPLPIHSQSTAEFIPYLIDTELWLFPLKQDLGVCKTKTKQKITPKQLFLNEPQKPTTHWLPFSTCDLVPKLEQFSIINPQPCQPACRTMNECCYTVQPEGRCRLHVGSWRFIHRVFRSLGHVGFRPEDAEAGLGAGGESAEPKSLASLQVSQRKCKVLHSYAIPHPVNRISLINIHR